MEERRVGRLFTPLVSHTAPPVVGWPKYSALGSWHAGSAAGNLSFETFITYSQVKLFFNLTKILYLTSLFYVSGRFITLRKLLSTAGYVVNTSTFKKKILLTSLSLRFSELTWWDWRSTWLTNHRPSVLWHCWVDHFSCKIVSKMTYNVSIGMLNPSVAYTCGTGWKQITNKFNHYYLKWITSFFYNFEI